MEIVPLTENNSSARVRLVSHNSVRSNKLKRKKIRLEFSIGLRENLHRQGSEKILDRNKQHSDSSLTFLFTIDQFRENSSHDL
jgi:hypothetical protein